VAAAGLAGPVGVVGPPEAVGDADLVVNATSVGMGDAGGLPLDAARLGPGQVVVDLVYHPLRTPLLDAAEAAGARAVGGLGMLVHQAGHAFALWTGEPPPLEAMAQGAAAALADRGGS
jgi:shikimate dehydrogenase